jgi:DNA-binding NarL/FixJ family response regulator/HAMP domain-containing protein
MYLDLKSSLLLRLVAGALAGFFIATGLALFGTYRDVRQDNARVADIVVRRLQIQLSHIESGIDATTPFPDFDLVSNHLQSPGQCVQYIATDGQVARSSCIGFNREMGTPPAWFAALDTWIPAPQADVVRPISYRDRPQGSVVPRGSVVVTTERAAVLAAIWRQVSGMLGLTALVIAAICILQYGAISRVLRPTRDILAGLDRLALGDLSSRLPRFRVVELQRISEAFNALAANLERTTREKMQLATKLVDHQEQERLDLARDLHDELAQSLSAMNAVAASIKTTAETECPALVPDARNLSRTSMAAMTALRATLRALRPPEIDDFGLAASLAALAREHEQLAGGRLKISLRIEGDLRALPPTAAAHVYRIVQRGSDQRQQTCASRPSSRRSRLLSARRGCRHIGTALADLDDRERWMRNGRPWHGCTRQRVRAHWHAGARQCSWRAVGRRRSRRRGLQAPRDDPVRSPGEDWAMSSKAIRILIVDDHAIVREGYRALLGKHEGLTVVAEAGDAASAYQCYKDERPDVVIIDISMPGRGGIDAIQHIREFDAQARTLVFTMHSGAAYALQAFRAGARGYVTKSSAPDVLVSAVRTVAEGRIAICPEIAQVLAFGRVQHGKSQLEDLSPREFEILRMILEARTPDEIASAFHLSRKTVANYHYNIKSKLGVSSDIELLYFGLQQGIVAPVAPVRDQEK